MTTPMSTDAKIAQMDTRLTLIEEKVTQIDAKVDARFDEVMTAIGVSPNAALGTPGSGLAGSVSALLAAEEARKREEQAREAVRQEQERRRKTIIALLSAAGTLAGILHYMGVFQR